MRNSIQVLSAKKLVSQSIFNSSIAGRALNLSETGDFSTSSPEHKNNMCPWCAILQSKSIILSIVDSFKIFRNTRERFYNLQQAHFSIDQFVT